MPIIREKLREEEVPRYNYFLYTFFKSFFLTQLFTIFNLWFRRVRDDFPLNQHDKDKKGIVRNLNIDIKTLQHFHFIIRWCMFHIINKYYNSWQRDKFCNKIDIIIKSFKSQTYYQHIYNKFMFKLSSHLHHHMS